MCGSPSPADEHPTDGALVRAFLASRSEGDFLVLHRRHTPVLYRLAWRLLQHRADLAEDAVQEAWLRAVRGLQGFRGDSSLRTWLVGILLHCVRERARGEQRHDHAPAVVLASHPAPGADGRAPSGQRLDLEGAVTALAPGYREVLLLHDVEGHTHADIAHLLGITTGTSKSQLARARQSLRATLDVAPRTEPGGHAP